MRGLKRRAQRCRRRKLLKTILAAGRTDPDSVQTMLARLESCPLPTAGPAVIALVPRAYRQQAADCVRQEAFFLLRSLDSHAAIRRAVAGVDCRLVAPLPAAWRRAMRESGLSIAPIACTLSLWLRSGRQLLRGAYFCLRLLGRQRRLPAAGPAPAAVVLEMAPAVLPPEAPAVRPLYDYITSVRRALRIPADAAIWMQTGRRPAHTRADGIVLTPEALSRLGRPLRTLPALADCVRILATGSLLWLCGSWRAGLLAPQAAMLAYARRLPDTAFAAHYVFSVSGWVVRPLWTYRAARAGADCAIVYYSSNSVIVSADAPPRTAHGSGEALATWDHYVVPSDDLQASLDEQHRRRIAYTVEPLLGVEDNGHDCRLDRPERTVASFDINVYAKPLTARIVRLPDYVTLAMTDAFHRDLLYCAEALDLDIARKPKRAFGPLIHPGYKRSFEQSGGHPRMIAVDPAVAAARVVATCAATVVMPFSTPAIYGIALGRPAVYYDPSGRMAAHTPKFHGVPVISGRVALLQWLEHAVGAPAAASVCGSALENRG